MLHWSCNDDEIYFSSIQESRQGTGVFAIGQHMGNGGRLNGGNVMGSAVDGGAAAVELCQGFGIPEHLIQAPIATDWRKI